MGLVMNTGSVKSQLEAMNIKLNEVNFNANLVLDDISLFLNTADNLKGDTYDSIRECYRNLHVPVVHGIVLYIQILIEENDTYKENIERFLSGIGKVDEDELKNDKQNIQAQIDHVKDLMLTTTGSFSPWISSLENTKRLIEKKLEQIDDFKNVTQGLYQGFKYYQDNIQQGIRCIESIQLDTSTGKYIIGPLNLQWINELEDFRFEREMISKLEEYQIRIDNAVNEEERKGYINARERYYIKTVQPWLCNHIVLTYKDSYSGDLPQDVLALKWNSILSVSEVCVGIDAYDKYYQISEGNVSSSMTETVEKIISVINENNVEENLDTYLDEIVRLNGNYVIDQCITVQLFEECGCKREDFLLNPQETIKEYKEYMRQYGIFDPVSIKYFLASCMHESGMGSAELENYSGGGAYNADEKGTGFIQLTWEETQKLFLESIGVDVNMENRIEYIASNHPFDSATWFWTNKEAKAVVLPDGNYATLNEYLTKHKDSDALFALSQYYVNSVSVSADYLNLAVENDMRVVYQEDGLLNIGGKQCTPPVGWSSREVCYDTVTEFFDNKGVK